MVHTCKRNTSKWTDQLTIAMLIPDVWKTGVRVTKDEDGIAEGGEIKSCMESGMGERRNVEKERQRMEGFNNGNSYHEKWAFRQQSERICGGHCKKAVFGHRAFFAGKNGSSEVSLEVESKNKQLTGNRRPWKKLHQVNQELNDFGGLRGGMKDFNEQKS
ncbi:hypothetical protein NC651_010068 [Populus alba x Populus x berolinensis]|nr:hypothetical protein NC651_010068 [Populus alba x Populus x berolinensis]